MYNYSSQETYILTYIKSNRPIKAIMNTEICLKSIFFDDLSLDCNDFFINLNGEVNSKSASIVCAKLYDLDKKGLPFIPLVLNSDGGCVDALHTILSAMDSVVTPIATIVNSKAISAAAVIFLMGSNGLRYMCPNSFIMCHEASSFNLESVKTCDSQALQMHLAKTDKLLNDKVCKHVGLPSTFFNDMGHVDTYYSATECKKLNLCDHVGLPTLRINFSLAMSIDVKNKQAKIADPEKRPYKYQKFISDTKVSVDQVSEDDE